MFDDFRCSVREESHFPAVNRCLGADGERAAEDNLVRFLDNVNESTHPDDLRTDLADVDVARSVDLQEAQESLVDTATVVEVKHMTGLDNGVGIVDRSKIQPPGRHAPELPVLDRRGDLVGNALFAGDRNHAVWYAKPYINYSARSEFGGGPASDDFARAERQAREVLLRHVSFAAEGGLEFRLVGLPVVFVDDQCIDETARNADIARVERASWNDSADGRNRRPAGCFGGLGEGAIVPEPGLLTHG